MTSSIFSIAGHELGKSWSFVCQLFIVHPINRVFVFFSDVVFDAICLVSICFFVTFVVHTMWNTKLYDGSVVRLFWEFAACNSPVSLLDSCNVFKPLDYRMPPRSATCWEPKKKGPCYMVARHNLTAGVWVEILKFSMEFNVKQPRCDHGTPLPRGQLKQIDQIRGFFSWNFIKHGLILFVGRQWNWF